jgi:hypothetical protein
VAGEPVGHPYHSALAAVARAPLRLRQERQGPGGRGWGVPGPPAAVAALAAVACRRAAAVGLRRPWLGAGTSRCPGAPADAALYCCCAVAAPSLHSAAHRRSQQEVPEQPEPGPWPPSRGPFCLVCQGGRSSSKTHWRVADPVWLPRPPPQPRQGRPSSRIGRGSDCCATAGGAARAPHP